MHLTSPSTMAVTATGAKVGILGRQSRRLDLEDSICRGVLRGDGGAALTLADKGALWVWWWWWLAGGGGGHMTCRIIIVS